jgi:hypothetical protein
MGDNGNRTKQRPPSRGGRCFTDVEAFVQGLTVEEWLAAGVTFGGAKRSARRGGEEVGFYPVVPDVELEIGVALRTGHDLIVLHHDAKDSVLLAAGGALNGEVRLSWVVQSPLVGH